MDEERSIEQRGPGPVGPAELPEAARWESRYGCGFLVAALCALSVVVMVVVGPRIHEEVSDSLVVSILTIKKILAGSFTFWMRDIGPGVPTPFAQNLFTHPVAYLYALENPAPAIALFYAGHFVLGCVFFIKLLRVLSIPRRFEPLLLLTYVFSSSGTDYFIYAYWPTVMIGWSMLPVLAYCSVRYFTAESASEQARTGLWLGFATTFLVWNAHLGHAVAWLSGLLLFALAGALAVGHLARPRHIALTLSLAAIIVLAIAAKPLALYGETQFTFEGGHPPPEPRLGFLLSWDYANAVWSALFSPLFRPELGGIYAFAAAGDWKAVLGDLFRQYLRKVDLVYFHVFIGGPFFILAVWQIARLRRHRDAWILAAAGALLFSWLCLGFNRATPVLPTGSPVFRDPVNFFAILLAAATLAAWARRKGSRCLIAVMQGLQYLALAGTAAPLLYLAFTDARARPILSDQQPAALVSAMRETMVSDGRVLNAAGLYLLAHNGFPLLNNVVVKGVSAEVFAPDMRILYGGIFSPPEQFDHRPLLDLMGVRYVIRLQSAGLFADLVPLRSLDRSNGDPIEILENPTAWPQAWLMAPAGLSLALPVRADCGHALFTCRDLSGIDAYRLKDHPVRLQWEGDRVVALFPPLDQPAVLVLSQMYRPGWQGAVAAGPAAAAVPVFGALVGVQLPAGATRAELAYRPAVQIFLTVAGLITTLLLGIGAVALEARRRWSR